MAQKNMTGYTFDHAPVPASADGNLYNELSLEDRVIKGYADELPVTSYKLKMTIGAGQFLSRGRLVEVKGPIDIDVPPLYRGYLIAHLDLSQINDYTSDPSTTEYQFLLNQADIRLTQAPLANTPDVHDTIIGTVSATSTNVKFTKDWRFFNPDLLRRNTEIIGSNIPNFGYGNNYRLGSTSTAVDDHSDTLLLPILANSNNQVNIDDVPPYNYDAISDEDGFTGTLPPVTPELAVYSRLEYRWTQTRAYSRVFEKFYVTGWLESSDEGIWIRWHSGVGWTSWQKVATTRDLADLSRFSQNKIETINNAFYGGLSDVSGIRSQFISEIKPFRNAVMQQVWLDPYRAEWYITQSDSQTPEGFVISRLHASGKLISSVWLPSSGHGTQVIFKHDANNDVSFFVRYFDGTSNLYHGVYKDNTTFNKSDLTLVGSLASSATGQFMHYGNAFAQLADDGNLYIWQTEYNPNTSKFTQHADSMIVHKYAADIPSTTVGQGMTLIKKSAITGDNSDSETNKYIVIRLAGGTNNRATLYSWEIDIKTKKVVFIGEVNGLQNGPHGQFDPNTGNISGDFEPEGVSAVEYGLDNLGSGGIIWGLSTGSGGYRKSYLYGFLSETLSSLVNAMSLTKNEINAFYPESLGSSYSYMYQLRGNDVYRGQSTDYKRYKDFPFPYRGSNATNIEWVLENIGNDMRNEWMQRLTILNYGFNVYTRKVSIDNLSYGKSPVYTYDKWSVNIDNAYVDETFKNTSSMASNSAIGMRYYFSSSEISGMGDSGLKSIIGERGAMLENRLLTNDSMIQTVTANSAAGRFVAYRKVSLKVDEFGTGGVISSPSNWFAG